MRTRVKICGITNVADAQLVAQLGADAIGLVFYTPSPRSVSIKQAAQIVMSLPPFVTTVALFVDALRTEVEQLLQCVPIDVLQFHGDESPAYCASFQRPYIKALRMQPDTDIVQQINKHRQAQGILLDTWMPGVPGGTGQCFDWQAIPQQLKKPLILAGGLQAENVGQAIRQVRPWAVDVSGGVEAGKGKKDADKLAAFMRAVAEA